MGKAMGTGDFLRTLADEYATNDMAYRSRKLDLTRTRQTHGIGDAHADQRTAKIAADVCELYGRAEGVKSLALRLIEESGRPNRDRLRDAFWGRVQLRRSIIRQNAAEEFRKAG